MQTERQTDKEINGQTDTDTLIATFRPPNNRGQRKTVCISRQKSVQFEN